MPKGCLGTYLLVYLPLLRFYSIERWSILLTTPRTRQLRQPQPRIITRHILKRNITMPSLFRTLLLRIRPKYSAVFVYFFGLFGADDAYFVVFAAETAAAVADGVDVEFGCWGFAGEFAEALEEGFLEFVG